MTLKRLFLRRIPTLASREAYAMWATAYPPSAHNPFMELEQETLLAMLPPLQGKTVLDLACGTGRWGRIAHEYGAARVISLDDSAAMLMAGRPPAAIAGTMMQLPLRAACVDVVICGLAVGHVSDLHGVLAAGQRVLRPDGVILLSDVHPARIWAGGQRTFCNDGRTYAVEHYVHSYADYHAAAHKLDMQIADVCEVSLKDGEPPVLLALKLTL